MSERLPGSNPTLATKKRAVNTYTYNQFSYVASYIHTIGVPVALIGTLTSDALAYYCWLLRLAATQRHWQNQVDTTRDSNPAHGLSDRAVKAGRKELKGRGLIRLVKRGVLELLNPDTQESLPERKKVRSDLHTTPEKTVTEFYEYFLGSPTASRPNGILFDCPWCQKKRGLFVRIADGEPGHSRWSCFGCGDGFKPASGSMVDFFVRQTKRAHWQAVQMVNDLLAGRKPWEPGMRKGQALTPAEETERMKQIDAELQKNQEKWEARMRELTEPGDLTVTL